MHIGKLLFGVILVLLIASMLTVKFEIKSAKAYATIYIRADGSIDPSTASIQRNGDLYNLTGDISAQIQIQRGNMTLDGTGYTVQGDGGGTGVRLYFTQNVTIQNMTVTGCSSGIEIYGSQNEVIGNKVDGNNYGISLFGDSNVLRNNAMTNNNVNFDPGYWPHLTNYVDASNTVNGKPIYHWINQTNRIVPVDAGYVALLNCSNIIVENITTGNNFDGIKLYLTKDSIVKNVSVANVVVGIDLRSCFNNTIAENEITSNQDGMWLIDYSNNNTISGNDFRGGTAQGILAGGSSNRVIGNNITSFQQEGIIFGASDNSAIVGNKITSNKLGISSSGSSNVISDNTIENNNQGGITLGGLGSSNSIHGNYIANNGIITTAGGILLGTMNNTITGNAFVNNPYGIMVLSSNNTILRNNFIGNTHQVGRFLWDSNTYVNNWDEGYSLGGNYWSDYNDTDLHSGPYQNLTGSDGIGDTPYIIDANNTDNYPLMGASSEFNVTGNYLVQAMSNSTISDFQYNGTALSFNVTGASGTVGFCRICIPTTMMKGTFHVLVNGTEVTYSVLPISNETYSYLYFNYTHSTEHVVIVIPEFLSYALVTLFIAATLLAVVVCKRKHMH